MYVENVVAAGDEEEETWTGDEEEAWTGDEEEVWTGVVELVV
jgi:hypothetical protein